MANTIEKIIEFNTGNGQRNLAALRQEIKDLREAMHSAVITQEDYDKAAQRVYEDQQKINQVMRDSKKPVADVEGSFNQLNEELRKLKEAWKATGDEMERAKLGEQINVVKGRMNAMNESIGNFQHNVGNYSGGIIDAFGKMGMSVGALNEPLRKIGVDIEDIDTSAKLLQGTLNIFTGQNLAMLQQILGKVTSGTQAFIAGLNGVQKAIIGTGIGALVVALGTMVVLWDDIKDAIGGTESPMQLLINQTNDYLASMEDVKMEVDRTVQLMGALGASQLEIATFRANQLQGQLDGVNANLVNQQTHLDSLNTWWRKIGRAILSVLKYIIPVGDAMNQLFGTKADIDGLKDSISKLTDEQKKLDKELYNANTSKMVAEIKEGNEATKKTTVSTRDRAAATKELVDILATQREIEAALKEAGDPTGEFMQGLEKALEIRQKEIDVRKTAMELEVEEYEQKKALLEEYGLSTEELTENHLEKMAELRAEESRRLYKELDEQKAAQKKKDEEEAESHNKLMKARKEATANMASGTASILKGLSAAFGESTKMGKGFAIAAATIDTIASAVTGFRAGMNQWADAGPMAWMGPVQAALNASAALVAGFAEVQKIQAVDTSGNATASSGAGATAMAMPNIAGLSSPVDYTSQVTTATEQEQLNKNNRVYILESDIQESNNRVRVREEETTF